MFLRLLFIFTVLSSIASAGNWPQWRGPNLNGSAEEKNLPVQWSTTEGIKWSAELPGPSGATPAVWGDSVFVTSPNANKELSLYCFNRADGKLRWERKVADGNIDKGKGNSASPSPITDGKSVWALFGTGDLAAFDFAGKELWKRNLGEDYGRFSIMWIYGSSPLLYQGKLFLQVLQRTPAPDDYPGIAGTAGDRESYVLALDPSNGKTLWKQTRPTDSVMESQESYATPIPHEANGKSQVLILGGDAISGHDAETGKEIWRAAGMNRLKGRSGGEWMRIVPSVVSTGKLAIVSGPKQSPLIAYKTDGSGDTGESAIAWKLEKAPDCCTPAFWNGKLYVLDGDKHSMTCVDAESGKVLWTGDLGTREIFRSSPTVADGKIYCLGEKGTVVVLDATASECKILSTISMGGPESTRSSVAVSDGQLFIRTGDKLFCVGK